MTITSTDKYRVVGEVGSGGMGIVYQAVQTRLDRRVAIKVLKPRYARDPGFVQRFRQEARALAALPHTHIVQIYDIERVGDDLWIVMEWVEGRTLRDVLKDAGPVAWERLVPILRQCADALQTAHDAGIVHRDVKPENILVTPDDTIKIMDFGVAMFLDPARRGAGEDPGMGMGSPRYMAPEQLAGEPSDARVDQYALALVTFEMCTGTFPFPGGDVYAVGHEKLHGTPLNLTDVWDEAPAYVAEGIAQALARDPEERFPTVDAFMDAIDPAPPKPLPLLPFALGAALTFALLFTGFYFLRPAEPPAVIVQVPAEVTPEILAAAVEAGAAVQPAPKPDPLVPLLESLDEALGEEKYDDALALIEEIATHDPDHPRASAARQQINLARAQARLLADAIASYEAGAIAEAKGMFRAVLAAEPESAEAQEYIAQIERQERVEALLRDAQESQAEGEITSAKQVYEDVLALDPGRDEAQRALEDIAAAEEREEKLAEGHVALEAGNFSIATRIYEEVLEEDPTNVVATRGLARVVALEEERARFDGAAYATEVNRLIGRLDEAIAGLNEAINAQERAFPDGDVRRAGRVVRSTLATYQRAVTPPLAQFARSVETAGASTASFPDRVENAAGRMFSLADAEQHNQRERVRRSLGGMGSVLTGEGSALAAGPTRIVTRARQTLTGDSEVAPLNDAVLVYRRPLPLLARLGRPRSMDPVEAVSEQLEPLYAALNDLETESRRAAGPNPSPAAVALLERISRAQATGGARLREAQAALVEAHGVRAERDAAARETLRAEITGVLDTLDLQAETTGARYRESLAAWRDTLEQSHTHSRQHFDEEERRAQDVAAHLTREITEFAAAVGARLAEERRRGEVGLAQADVERAWLTEQIQIVTGCATQEHALGALRELDAALGKRAKAAGDAHRRLHASFESVAAEGRSDLEQFQRQGTVLLRDRVSNLQARVRETAGRVHEHENRQVKALRDAAGRVRDLGATMDAAIEGYGAAVADARAGVGGHSRNAFGELEQTLESATREVGAVEQELAALLDALASGSGADSASQQAAEARVAALGAQVHAAAAALRTYSDRLEAAALEAEAQRRAAADTLLTVLAAQGEALAAAVEDFRVVAEDLSGKWALAVDEILQASEQGLVQFEERAAELTAGPAEPVPAATATG